MSSAISLLISDCGLSSTRRMESVLSLGHFGLKLHLTRDSVPHGARLGAPQKKEYEFRFMWYKKLNMSLCHLGQLKGNE